MVHRTSTTTAKAQTFVLRVHGTGKREYVSSLWDGPTPGTYALEYKEGLAFSKGLSDGDEPAIWNKIASAFTTKPGKVAVKVEVA